MYTHVYMKICTYMYYDDVHVLNMYHDGTCAHTFPTMKTRFQQGKKLKK